MQMTQEGLVQTFYTILRKEGPVGFYRGIGAPLVSVPLINSIVFSSYELSKKFFSIFFHKEKLSVFERTRRSPVAICGAVAGNVNAVAVTPVELVKIKLQMQKQKRKYKNTIDCMAKLLYKGGPKGSGRRPPQQSPEQACSRD